MSNYKTPSWVERLSRRNADWNVSDAQLKAWAEEGDRCFNHNREIYAGLVQAHKLLRASAVGLYGQRSAVVKAIDRAGIAKPPDIPALAQKLTSKVIAARRAEAQKHARQAAQERDFAIRSAASKRAWQTRRQQQAEAERDEYIDGLAFSE